MIKKIIFLSFFASSLLAPSNPSLRHQALQARVGASVKLVESMLQRSPKIKVYCLNDFYNAWNETCEILNERSIEDHHKPEIEIFIETLKEKIKENRNFDPLKIDQRGL